jgi:hypothetical protein
MNLKFIGYKQAFCVDSTIRPLWASINDDQKDVKKMMYNKITPCTAFPVERERNISFFQFRLLFFY